MIIVLFLAIWLFLRFGPKISIPRRYVHVDASTAAAIRCSLLELR
jgi:hypothetical protein